MSEHLLAMAIGPVQDFIAAARRTRDLWFGSHVLSEISKAAAKAVADQVGLEALIFPAPLAAAELAPHDKEAKLAVANVILVRLPSGTVPADVAKAAQRAAQTRWREFAEKAKQCAGQIREDVWHDQVDGVVEFYSAWAALPSVAEYRETRKLVMRLLSGRKACRNFAMAKGRAKLPKSSLDGARETVLLEKTTGNGRLPLTDGEQLDVIGLTKRLAGGPQSYPSVARIAADPWLRRLAESESHAPEFRDLKDVCKQLVQRGVLSGSHMPSQAFPYDGTAVFVSRHADFAKEMGQANDSQTQEDLKTLAAVVRPLIRPIGKGGLGEPSPYFAILVADGDRMGAAISQIASPEAHRRFSRELSSFAERAKQVVQDANGVCVYAGGDDVLAFVPLDSCLKCARELHSAFCTTMGNWQTSENKSPTLSVGIAIGHFMEPLEDLLGFGRAAEQAAKKGLAPGRGEVERDALAVVVRTRGAAPISVRDNWKECDDDAALDQRLNHWAELFANGSLPNKLPYELRQLVSVYDRWPSKTPEELKALETVLGKDVKRIMRRKRTNLLDEDREDGSDQQEKARKACDRKFLEERIHSITSVALLRSLAEELLVAQQISPALPQQPESFRKQREEAIG